jgi:hypothetical protein
VSILNLGHPFPSYHSIDCCFRYEASRNAANLLSPFEDPLRGSELIGQCDQLSKLPMLPKTLAGRQDEIGRAVPPCGDQSQSRESQKSGPFRDDTGPRQLMTNSR